MKRWFPAFALAAVACIAWIAGCAYLPGNAKNDLDKLAQYRGTITAAQDTVSVAYEEKVITGKQYLAVYDRALLPARKLHAKLRDEVRAGKTIEQAAWDEIDSFIDRALAESVPSPPATQRAAVPLVGVIALLNLLTQIVQTAQRNGREELTDDEVAKINAEALISDLRADANADRARQETGD